MAKIGGKRYFQAHPGRDQGIPLFHGIQCAMAAGVRTSIPARDGMVDQTGAARHGTISGPRGIDYQGPRIERKGNGCVGEMNPVRSLHPLY